MWDTIKQYKSNHPVFLLLIIGFIPRLVSIIFSKGYGMHDDHFLVIEAAQSWVDGYDYNAWLPWNQENPVAKGHSFFYVGIHFLILKFFAVLGLEDPQVKMFWIRLMHGLYSLLAIPPIYYISKKISNTKIAFDTTLIFALLWFLPLLSVRNLVELVSVPPLLWATWVLFKNEKIEWKSALGAGLLLGVAMAVRFHMSLFIGGIGLVLLFQCRIIPAIIFGLGVVVSLSITQAGDLVIWGKPFVELTEYVMYNLANKKSYFVAPWYQYIGTVGGLLLPPLGAIWFFFFFKNWKRYTLLFWPCLIFFLFHSYFPNKQERFILPVIPFFIILGNISWVEFVEKRPKWATTSKWFYRIFWGINSFLLLVVSPAYSKRSRVESMSFVGSQPNYNGVVVEYSVKDSAPMMPLFYTKSWNAQIVITDKKTYGWGRDFRDLNSKDLALRPNHIVFFEPQDIESRVANIEQEYNCSLIYMETIDPSYVDATLHWLNPFNNNETAFVYEIKYNS